jgi:alanine-synthesizing transaminase
MDLRRVDDLPLYVFSLIGELIVRRRAGGADVIDFGIGSPDTATPDVVVERLVAEARDPRNHGYPTSAGLSRLREALAGWYERRYGVRLDPATQTLVTWGGSEALAHLPWVLLGPGDTALVPEPCYPIHRYAVQFAGAAALPVRLDGASGDLATEVESAWAVADVKPRLLLISFPHNPTTRCVELDELARVVAFAHRNDVVVIHDFAYADIAFDDYRPPSILQVPGAADVAVELVSLSKSHNMAGWRLGFVAGNAEVVAGLARLKSYLDYGVTKPVQLMGVTALEECADVPVRMAGLYERRRDVLCDGLAALGWPVERPAGTMFVWARIPEPFRAGGSLAFARHLIEEGDVATSPGIGFTAGPDVGRGSWADEHVRFALVQPEELIGRALEGIARALDRPVTTTTPGDQPLRPTARTPRAPR